MTPFHLWVANAIAELGGEFHHPTVEKDGKIEISPVKAYVSGVYFLSLLGEVVYIGKSKNIYLRISQHMKRSFFTFDAFAFIESGEDEINELEARYIHEFNPRYNIDFPSHGEIKHSRKSRQ